MYVYHYHQDVAQCPTELWLEHPRQSLSVKAKEQKGTLGAGGGGDMGFLISQLWRGDIYVDECDHRLTALARNLRHMLPLL